MLGEERALHFPRMTSAFGARAHLWRFSDSVYLKQVFNVNFVNSALFANVMSTPYAWRARAGLSLFPLALRKMHE